MKILERNSDISKGYVGLYFDTDIDFLKDIFKEGDIHEYGVEDKPHVTVFYGLTGEVDHKEIKNHIENMPIKNEDISIEGISLFENDEYDVVKLDIESEKLREYNKIFAECPNENEFPDYKPHLTLAYVKKGEGEKYLKDDIVDIISEKIKYVDLYYEYGMFGREDSADNIRFSIICE